MKRRRGCPDGIVPCRRQDLPAFRRQGFLTISACQPFSPDQEKEAAEIARKAAAEHAPVPVHLSHIGMFAGGKVLFAAPEKNEELNALQEACRSDAPQQYPWTPHVTMLIDEPETICAAIPVFVKSFVPFTARIVRLHLCAFWPTREIASFALEGVMNK